MAIVKTAETMEAMAFVVIVVALGAWFGLLGWADWTDTGLEFWASIASLGSHVTTQPMAGLAERLEQGEVVMSLRPTEGPGRP